MTDRQSYVVVIPPVSVSEDNGQHTASEESASESGDATNDVDLVKTPFSTKTSINETALVLGGEKLYVSKHVLGLVSPVFRAMFAAMAEKNIDEIPLPGKRLSDVIELLLCVYPDTRKPITEKNARVLVPLFDEYLVESLKAVCDRTLAQSCTEDTDIDTLFEHLLLTSTYNMGDHLRRRCIQLASTRNTDTLREAGRKCALPSDVTSELWENVTKMRDSEIRSLIDMKYLLPNKQGFCQINDINYVYNNKKEVSVTSSKQLQLTPDVFPQYIRAIQTTIYHKLPNEEDTLLEMFLAEMNNTEKCDIIQVMSKLPKNIKDKLSTKYKRVLLK